MKKSFLLSTCLCFSVMSQLSYAADNPYNRFLNTGSQNLQAENTVSVVLQNLHTLQSETFFYTFEPGDNAPSLPLLNEILQKSRTVGNRGFSIEEIVAQYKDETTFSITASRNNVRILPHTRLILRRDASGKIFFVALKYPQATRKPIL